MRYNVRTNAMCYIHAMRYSDTHWHLANHQHMACDDAKMQCVTSIIGARFNDRKYHNY